MNACTSGVTRQALYQVFVAPQTLRSAPSLVLRHHTPCVQAIKPTPTIRRISARATPTREPSIFDDPTRPLDAAIRSPLVHLVTLEGLERGRHLQDLLANIDRSTEHVRQVSLGDDRTPIVKIVSKKSLFEEARKSRPKKQAEDKQMELNWAIDLKGDLSHRLKKLKTWLEEGKNVEILLAPKKGGRRATEDDCQHLLKRIYGTVEEVKGAREAKPMQGSLGRRATILLKNDEAEPSEGEEDNRTFEAREMSREEKMAKKEQEKKERLAEMEARAKRKEERRAQQRIGTAQPKTTG